MCWTVSPNTDSNTPSFWPTPCTLNLFGWPELKFDVLKPAWETAYNGGQFIPMKCHGQFRYDRAHDSTKNVTPQRLFHAFSLLFLFRLLKRVYSLFTIYLLLFCFFSCSWKARGMRFLQSCCSSALIPRMPSLSSGASLVPSALVSAYAKVLPKYSSLISWSK